jgi:class 3 adenylate cyclase
LVCKASVDISEWLRGLTNMRRPSAPTAEPVTLLLKSAARPDAERRQVTILFCDLVGSTAFLARFNSEDLRGVIGTYHCCCAGVIESTDGYRARSASSIMLPTPAVAPIFVAAMTTTKKMPKILREFRKA